MSGRRPPAGVDLVEHLRDQRDWSTDTFGPGHRIAGVLDHIAKEVGEIEAAAGADLEEWVDVVLLGFDGAWRAGHSPADIAFTFFDRLDRRPVVDPRNFPAYDDALAGIRRHAVELLDQHTKALAAGDRSGRTDVELWVDLVLLAFYGAAAGAGATPHDVLVAMVAKLATNKARTWPDWRGRQGQAIEHIREGST